MSEDVTGEGPNEPVKRLSRDLAKAAATMTDQEARYLVDSYYMMQDDRKRSANQVLALGTSAEPNSVLLWLEDQSSTLEKQIARALDKYTQAHPMAEWMRGVYGIGPVLSAGLLAHISMERWGCKNEKAKKPCKEGSPCTASCGKVRTETAGHIWRFAGLDPTVKWEKGQKRPWNAQLKTLCWKIGQSFIKFSNKEECVYGHLYKERKLYELQRNDRGENVQAAQQGLLKIKDKNTDAHKWLVGCYPLGTQTHMQTLEQGKRTDYLKSVKLEPGKGTPALPPAQIDQRAARWATKIFLSHLHQVWYKKHFGVDAPAPYAISILGHANKIEPSN